MRPELRTPAQPQDFPVSAALRKKSVTSSPNKCFPNSVHYIPTNSQYRSIRKQGPRLYNRTEKDGHMTNENISLVNADPGYTQAVCPASMALLAESTSEF